MLRPMSIIIVVLLASVLNVNASFIWAQKLENLDKIYSLRPTLFVLFEKSNFLREHHLLYCLPFKNV